jgi:hypothetical protein
MLTAARIVVLNLAWMFPLFLCGVGLRDTSVNAQEKAAQPRFKNLQVLKDIPPDQVIPAMQFISALLGVESLRRAARRACGAFPPDGSLALVSMRRYATQR